MVTEAFYHEVQDLLWKSEAFEKRAEHDPSDVNLATKTNHDVQVFNHIKQAVSAASIKGGLQAAGQAVGRGAASGGKALGKGMLYGAAPAVTAIGAGALAAPYVIDHAAKTKEEATKRVVADIRNKALQAALGIGAIGAGLTGMHHLLAGRRENAAQQQAPHDAVNFSNSQGLFPRGGVSDYGKYGSAGSSYLDMFNILDGVGDKEEALKDTVSNLRNKALYTALGIGAIGAGLLGVHHLNKTASAQPPALEEELLEKLATVGYLDSLLEGYENHEKRGEDATHCRLLNAEHGVHLLRQLLRS